MNVLSTKRAAAFGMAGALALGTVVSTGVLAPADAATGTYTCTLTSGPVPLGVSANMTLPASVQSGSSLAGLAGDMGVTLPAPVVAGLAGLGIKSVGGTASGVAFPVGTSSILLNDISIPQTLPATDGTLTLASATTSKGNRAPLPGSYPVMMPTDFSFVPLADLGTGAPAPLGSVPCHSDTPATIGTLSVVQATSRTTAKLANAPALTSKRPKILAKVTAAGYAATGKVIAKMGTKTLATGTLSGGKKVLVLPKLSKGKHTIKVIYKATQANKASSAAVTFTTRRG